MRGEDLISEGQSLVRPSLELETEPSDETTETSSQGPVGTWRAKRSLDAADGGRLMHLISVSCEWLKAQGLPVSGTLSVYSAGTDAVPVLEPHPLDPETCGGRLLWGTEEPSFPPPEALCLHGSPRVEAWLAERGWSRKDGAEAVIHRTPEGQAYVRKWQRYCPLYEREPPVAVLGGWPVMWPEDDVYGQRGRLLLWTLRGAEPWFEVWIDAAGCLSAVARIT